VDPALGYRLLRALTSIGVLTENSSKEFSLTPVGEIFTASHPASLKHSMMWEVNRLFSHSFNVKHCKEIVTAWTFLPQAVKSGKQQVMAASLGVPSLWVLLESNPELKTTFDNAMTSYSKVTKSCFFANFPERNALCS
jgi:hypothetical protein